MNCINQLKRWTWWASCVGLLALAGCQVTNRADAPADPFLGPRSARIPPTQVPPELRSATSFGADAQGNTNAALASGFRPVNPAAPVAPAPTTGKPQDFTTPPSNPVQPATHAPWNASPSPPANLPAAVPTTGGGLSWEQARAYLAGRGVTQQRLELREGVWHFECCVPDPVNPTQLKMYRATSGSDVEAIRLVLEKMQTGR